MNDKGITTDAHFDLIEEPWLSRFQTAALDLTLQAVQIDTALEAFQASLGNIRAYAPQLPAFSANNARLHVHEKGRQTRAGAHEPGGAKGQTEY